MQSDGVDLEIRNIFAGRNLYHGRWRCLWGWKRDFKRNTRRNRDVWDVISSNEEVRVFPEYALHMTEIGEQTGRLDETMEALAAYYQREEEIFEAVKAQ